MIYFIGNKEYDWVKIGFSRDPECRLIGIQTGCPVELTIFYTHPGAQRVEKKLHTLFKESWLRGEWFVLHGPVQDYIDQKRKVTPHTRIDDLLADTELKKQIIEMHDSKIKVDKISSALDLSKSAVKRLISQYEAEKDIRNRLDERMYKKLGLI